MKYDVWLCDDGTMDTVVGYTCPDCGRTHELRYSDTADYRGMVTGALRQDEFFRDVVIPDIDSDTCPLAEYTDRGIQYVQFPI